MKKHKKRLFFITLIFIFLAISVYEKWPDSSIKIVFCDVGQGDSVLIQQDFFQILLDSGKDDRVLDCLGKFLPIWDRTLELVIMTHGDEDHIGYFEEILGMYETKYLFFPDTDKDTLSLRGLKEAISQEESEGAFLKEPILGQSVRLPSGGALTFLKSPGLSSGEISENDRSIVFLLEYQGYRWLFTGDLEEKGERALAENGLLSQVEGLKAGHHGSGTSSIPEFLEKTRPKITVISVGAENSYGHPAPLVLQRLKEIGSIVLRTDQLGSIEFLLTDHGAQLQSVSGRR